MIDSESYTGSASDTHTLFGQTMGCRRAHGADPRRFRAAAPAKGLTSTAMDAAVPTTGSLYLVVGYDASSSQAMHRVVGSVAVSLARHSRVPVVIVP